jgi:hypothetical protein
VPAPDAPTAFFRALLSRSASSSANRTSQASAQFISQQRGESGGGGSFGSSSMMNGCVGHIPNAFFFDSLRPLNWCKEGNKSQGIPNKPKKYFFGLNECCG